MTADPLGMGGPPGGQQQQQQAAPNFIGVQPWAAPTYPGATPFSPPTTQAPAAPLLASTQAPQGVLGPKYLEGDENSLRGLSVETLARMQQRMVAAGLIDKQARYRLGLADDTTVRAYYQLLGFANRYGISDDEALTRLEQTPIAKPPGGGKQTSTSTNKQTYVTPKAAAQKAIRDEFEAELGRAPSDREYRVYQRLVNRQERASPATSVTTTTTDSDSGNSSSSTVTTPSSAPEPGVLAEQTVRQGELGVERNTRKVTDYLDAAMSVLGPGGSGFGG